MFLATGGFRAVEALSVRVKDLDLDAKPAKVFVRGEYTKTNADRVVLLTEEIAQQLRSWLTHTNIEKGGFVIMERTYQKIAVQTKGKIYKVSGALRDSLENRLRKSGYVEGKDIPNIKTNHKPIRMTLFE